MTGRYPFKKLKRPSAYLLPGRTRLIQPGGLYTMDHRPDRLNIILGGPGRGIRKFWRG